MDCEDPEPAPEEAKLVFGRTSLKTKPSLTSENFGRMSTNGKPGKSSMMIARNISSIGESMIALWL